MRYGILILMLICFPVMLFSQGSLKQFSMEEAQEYALKNNKTYKNAQADVELADEQIKETKGAGLPQVEGTLDYMTNFGYEFEFNLGGEPDPEEIDFSVMDAGDFEVLKILNSMSSPGGSTIVMSDQSSANFQVSQLVFSGQFWVGLEMAKLSKDIMEKNLTLSALDIKEQVINSYYLILVTEDLLSVIEDNVANLKEILTHTDNMYKAGLAEITDVDQIRINISQLDNSKKAMERNIELNYNMFRNILGIEAGTPIELSEDIDSILEDFTEKVLLSNNIDLNNNINYQMMLVQEQIGEKSVDMQKWAFAPTLVGFYNYKEKIMTSGFDLSPNHAAGFTLNIPIFSGGTKSARMSQAKIELEKTSRSISLLEDQLNLQNDQLNYNLNSAYENYITQKENVEIAKRVFESNNNKYQQGIISSLDLTQANTNYLQAENNYVSSILELLQSKLALDKLYNQL